MHFQKILPTIMIILQLASAFIYIFGANANWRTAVYWFACAILTTVVTY